MMIVNTRTGMMRPVQIDHAATQLYEKSEQFNSIKDSAKHKTSKSGESDKKLQIHKKSDKSTSNR